MPREEFADTQLESIAVATQLTAQSRLPGRPGAVATYCEPGGGENGENGRRLRRAAHFGPLEAHLAHSRLSRYPAALYSRAQLIQGRAVIAP